MTLKMPLMITALVLGIVLSGLFGKPYLTSGITFTSKTILRIGVALLGVRISLS